MENTQELVEEFEEEYGKDNKKSKKIGKNRKQSQLLEGRIPW